MRNYIRFLTYALYYNILFYIKNSRYHIENIIILLINNLDSGIRGKWDSRANLIFIPNSVVVHNYTVDFFMINFRCQKCLHFVHQYMANDLTELQKYMMHR